MIVLPFIAMSRPAISPAAAHRAITCSNSITAKEADLKTVFAILDTRAQLIAFSRMDGTGLALNELAMAKARASAMLQAPRETLNQPLKVREPVAHVDHSHSAGCC